MGELFDAIKLEAAKRPNVARTEERLQKHLGKERWKDFEKACLDVDISTSVILRVVKATGFAVSHSAIARVRTDLIKAQKS